MRRLIGSIAASALLTGTALVVGGPAEAAGTPWQVTIHASRTTLEIGHKVRFTGRVARSASGRLVRLQERFAADKPWRTQRNALVHRDGSYATYDVPTRNHRRYYRVVMPATTHHTRGLSETVQVDVFSWVPLTTFPAVNQSYLGEVTTVSMNGVDYPASLEASIYHPDGPTNQSIEFNLDHQCTRFRGTFGISDDSQSGSQASVDALADGAPWFSHTYAVGESDANAFAFETPPLKVRFETASLVDGADGLGAVGAPQVYCEQQ